MPWLREGGGPPARRACRHHRRLLPLLLRRVLQEGAPGRRVRCKTPRSHGRSSSRRSQASPLLERGDPGGAACRSSRRAKPQPRPRAHGACAPGRASPGPLAACVAGASGAAGAAGATGASGRSKPQPRAYDIVCGARASRRAFPRASPEARRARGEQGAEPLPGPRRAPSWIEPSPAGGPSPELRPTDSGGSAGCGESS